MPIFVADEGAAYCCTVCNTKQLMKKILTVMAFGALALGADAQRTVEGSRFFDNMSVGLVGGGITPASHSPFWGGMRPVYGVEITKRITPVMSIGVQGVAASNVSNSRTFIDASNVGLLSGINLSNLFAGYVGRPRTVEVEAVSGIGWGRNYVGGEEDDNFLTTRYGLNLNFNLGEQKAWTVALKPAIAYNMEGDGKGVHYNVNHAALEVMAGVTYHFKNSNRKNHFVLMRAYDQAEVDGLNAKINDLRAMAGEHESKLHKAKQRVRELERELNDCRNRQPVVETIVETEVVTNTNKTLESVVTFRQGKYSIDASQLPNVERIATYMRNHPEARVVIKGYASPEGSAEVNVRIANSRAQAVKNQLMSKYKIAADRITAEGQGIGDMYSEPDWNRVSICTIVENE